MSVINLATQNRYDDLMNILNNGLQVGFGRDFIEESKLYFQTDNKDFALACMEDERFEYRGEVTSNGLTWYGFYCDISLLKY